jgi:hypothetical protein
MSFYSRDFYEMQKAAAVLQVITGVLLFLYILVKIKNYDVHTFLVLLILGYCLILSGKEVFFYVEKHYKPLPEKNLKMMFDEAKKA